MTVIYIDKVFVFNTVIDYLLLLCTARLAGAALHRCRLLFCAAVGGMYAVAVFFPQTGFLAHPLLRAVGGILMALAAFWPQRRPLRLTALFFLLSSALAGLVLALACLTDSVDALSSRLYHADISWPLLLSTAIIMYLLLQLLFWQGARHGGGELMSITISINGQQRKVLSLHDTGNTLRDPVNGQAVLVLEQAVLKELWAPEVNAILSQPIPPEDKMVQLYRIGAGTSFTLLPFRSVGVSSGLLLAIRSDYIKIGKATHPRALIALSEGPVSDGGAYQALWGGTERREVYHEASADPSQLDMQAQQAG